MAVARGDAVVVTKDGRRIAADTLVAYTAPGSPAQAGKAAPANPPAASQGQGQGNDDVLAASGKLQKVEAYGHVSIRTAVDTVTGDRGVYVPETGIARLAGQVRITRGQNQLNGAEAEVNLKTGVARLLSGSAGRVQGLMVPNDSTNQGLAPPSGGTQSAKPPATAVHR
jgi:lipopolysaccharide export system protein LptA